MKLKSGVDKCCQTTLSLEVVFVSRQSACFQLSTYGRYKYSDTIAVGNGHNVIQNVYDTDLSNIKNQTFIKT